MQSGRVSRRVRASTARGSTRNIVVKKDTAEEIRLDKSTKHNKRT